MEACKARGAKRALPLPVSVPSHCALMKPAGMQLAEALLQVHINTPAIPVLHNADVASYSDAADIRDALVRQLLAFSRQQTLRPRVLDLTDVIAELSHLLARLMGERITVDVVHARDLKPDPEELPKIEGKISNGLPEEDKASAASADKKKEDGKGG
mgnify:CR=1 FL=1